jgi:hypothetical protein
VVLLEVAVDTLAGVLAARAGGAGRIELCSRLDVGGLSPAPELLREAIERCPLPIHAMVRLRPGHFVCSPADIEAMEAEIAALRRTRAARSGHRVILSSNGRLSERRAWFMPPAAPLLGGDSFLRRQIEAFEASLSRIDVSQSFLSLTGGLDTRTVLAGLLRKGRSVPAATLSGENLSLDARIAVWLKRERFGRIPRT